MNRMRVVAGATLTGVIMVATVMGLQSPAAAIPNVTYGSGSFVAAQHFEHENYGGSVLTRKVSSQCDADLGFDFGDPGWLPSNWDNDIDSFDGASSCWVKIFEEFNYCGCGASLAFAPIDNEVGGAMHDRTSSIQWS